MGDRLPTATRLEATMDWISKIHQLNYELDDAEKLLEFARGLTQESVVEIALRRVHDVEDQLDKAHIAYRQGVRSQMP